MILGASFTLRVRGLGSDGEGSSVDGGCDACTWGSSTHRRWEGHSADFLRWGAGRRQFLASRPLLGAQDAEASGLCDRNSAGVLGGAAAAWSPLGLCSKLPAVLCECGQPLALSGPLWPGRWESKNSASGAALDPVSPRSRLSAQPEVGAAVPSSPRPGMVPSPEPLKMGPPSLPQGLGAVAPCCRNPCFLGGRGGPSLPGRGPGMVFLWSWGSEPHGSELRS